MPWVIGIDEAGYGPNLGPLVMSAVACRAPESRDKNLWRLLRSVVRRQGDEDDGRLFVDDSKLVYSTARGLKDLEHAVLAALEAAKPSTLADLIGRVCPAAADELADEAWYAGTTALPLEASFETTAEWTQRFRDACSECDIGWPLVRSVVVCAPRFNALVDRWQSKGAVLALGAAELIRACCAAAGPEETLQFVVDKHGGRNHYSAVLQHAFDDGMVIAREEGALRSAYQVVGIERSITFSFEPRADSNHLCVALASMVSKYLREALMIEFNRFWQKHVPDLRPTAGYPSDSTRFFNDIRHAVAKLQITEARLWRQR